jgi:pentatricopeptide repeat protein
MKQKYQSFPFQRPTLALIGVLNAIVDEYASAGFVLTVRQLFYQMVARGIIPNTEKSYKKICRTVNDAKLAGLIDWDALEDRTRRFTTRSRWSSAAAIMETSAQQFHMDMWKNQDHRVCVIIEKEALYGVFSGTCHELDVPLLSARGYPSGSVLREFAKYTMLRQSGQFWTILHFGDHDPSGIDMSRDLEERMKLFCEYSVDLEFKRIALNMDQIEEFEPPPNPAKSSDSRFTEYYNNYGDESWELDALDPRMLQKLADDNIRKYIDEDAWNERHQEIEHARKRITAVKNLFFR